MQSDTTNEPQINQLFTDGKPRAYDKKCIIIQPGDPPSTISTIESGVVRSYSITDKGYESLAYIYKPPDVIPLSAAISGNDASLFFETVTDVEVRSIDRDVFLSRIHQDQNALMQLLQDSVQKLELITERINNTQFRSSQERVAYALLGLAKQFGEDDASGKKIALPVTHQFISESVGLSRETTSRQMEELHKRGAISYSGRTLFIKDIDYLSSVVK